MKIETSRLTGEHFVGLFRRFANKAMVDFVEQYSTKSPWSISKKCHTRGKSISFFRHFSVTFLSFLCDSVIFLNIFAYFCQSLFTKNIFSVFRFFSYDSGVVSLLFFFVLRHVFVASLLFILSN